MVMRGHHRDKSMVHELNRLANTGVAWSIGACMAAAIVVTVRCVEHALHENGNSYCWLSLVNVLPSQVHPNCCCLWWALHWSSLSAG